MGYSNGWVGGWVSGERGGIRFLTDLPAAASSRPRAGRSGGVGLAA